MGESWSAASRNSRLVRAHEVLRPTKGATPRGARRGFPGGMHPIGTGSSWWKRQFARLLLAILVERHRRLIDPRTSTPSSPQIVNRQYKGIT